MLGAAAIGALDALRLRSPGIAAAAIPVFALTGLLIGLVVVAAERASRDRPWWQAALAIAAPSLIVAVPVSASLFKGAYARTLPLSTAAPVVLPLLAWLGAAVAIAAGRRLLRATDLTTRAIAVICVAGAIGGLILGERRILQTGYPTAHLGATLAVCALAGVAVRIARRGAFPGWAGYAVAGAAVLAALWTAPGGLSDPRDRRVLATLGDQSRDLIGLWRAAIDLDRDGSSGILGGGDCDDLDRARHPGAVDTPSDGVDQDCDGRDARPADLEELAMAEDSGRFRDRPAVKKLLARTRGMNVLVLSVDALRADLLAPGAKDRGDFPHLTRLLAESVWFTRAYAPGSGTDISLSTLLTGRLDPFQPVAMTLPEAFAAAGYATHAVVPVEALRYAGETMLSRGIGQLSRIRTDATRADVGDHVSAPDTTDAGLRAIADAGDGPWFVWMHYFDVHESHQIEVPAELVARVAQGASPKATRYRALLRAIDDQIGRVLDELDARDLAARTIVVFASDHGESLGEDPRLLATHGKVVYAPLVHVPIALRVPGVPPGERTDLVSLVDLAPTLLDLLGIDRAPMKLDGENLVAALLDGPTMLRPVERALAIHEQEQWSVIEWPYQLLVRPGDDLLELYDLEADPLLRSDLGSTLPSVVARLKARFATFPPLEIDRSPAGRAAREQLARQRPRPAKR